MSPRYYRLAILVFLLSFVFAVYVKLVTPSTFPALQSGNLIVLLGVLIDLGILLLVVMEDFVTPFLNRPKPVIQTIVFRRRPDPSETFNLSGRVIRLLMADAVELWVNVRNDGKTSIKKARARAKIYSYPMIHPPTPEPPPRPEGVNETQWQEILRQTNERNREFRQFFERTQSEMLFGRPLPFSRTPRGTIGLNWIEADSRVTYETDLSPLNEASVKVIGIYLVPRREIQASGAISFGTPPAASDLAANAQYQASLAQRAGLIEAGNHSILVTGVIPGSSRLSFDLLLNFWVIGENITRDNSEILHIQIPESLDTIICDTLDRGTREYQEAVSLLTTQTS